ncbi:hypothetical protein DPMN_033170 [Dreissena polymorpha]|uniref:Uncharacterized protein n=1 Tax=Dreissena polymorpha TaxID=45954 RepID=A0A9D4M362_DREPO|nr:hypothetical protein DPMN_033170 [Dreissena polymorpha]
MYLGYGKRKKEKKRKKKRRRKKIKKKKTKKHHTSVNLNQLDAPKNSASKGSIKRKKLWISSDADRKYGSDNRRLGACSLIKHVISISNRDF